MELFFGSFQSAGRKSKSCQHNLDILSAEYVAISYIISIYIFIYTCTFGLVTRFCQQNIVLSHVKLSPWSTSFLGPMELFLVGLILPAEYPNSAGRILRFCRQNIVLSHMIYLHIYTSALYWAVTQFCQQNLDIFSKIFILSWHNHIFSDSWFDFVGRISKFWQQNIEILLSDSGYSIGRIFCHCLYYIYMYIHLHFWGCNSILPAEYGYSAGRILCYLML